MAIKYWVVPFNVRVKLDKLNIRKGPGTEYKIIDTSYRDDIFTITKVADASNGSKWGYIKLLDGWLSLNYVECDRIIEKYNELKSKGIDLGKAVKDRNTLPDNIPVPEKKYPFEFQCYSNGVILLDDPKCVWMSREFFTSYCECIRGFSEFLSICFPLGDEIHVDGKIKYCFIPRYTLYSKNNQDVKAIYEPHLRCKRFFEAGLFPESDFESVTISDRVHWTHYKSGDYVVTFLNNTSILNTIGIFKSCYSYVFTKNNFVKIKQEVQKEMSDKKNTNSSVDVKAILDKYETQFGPAVPGLPKQSIGGSTELPSHFEEQPKNVLYQPGKTAVFSVTSDKIWMTKYRWQYSTDQGNSWQNCENGIERTFSVVMKENNIGILYRCEARIEIYGECIYSEPVQIRV
ncbi:MAG: SH3 domain-containing protein [Lachnospiraceae bacterium]|nr:SH3 domain-containing protein [Lachnospiraceae bacterium]